MIAVSLDYGLESKKERIACIENLLKSRTNTPLQHLHYFLRETLTGSCNLLYPMSCILLALNPTADVGQSQGMLSNVLRDMLEFTLSRVHN